MLTTVEVEFIGNLDTRVLHKNTIYRSKSELDQFYTSESIAKECYDEIWKLYSQNDFSLILEPSAGTGSFFNLFPVDKRVGVDLEPKCNGIVKLNFFDYTPPVNSKIITIGNPPFGRIASTAIKFFNKAASFSSVIAFIIPKTFKKQSLQNKLSLNFVLKKSIDLPKNSFVLNGEPYDVPCCFQIWERVGTPRIIERVILENDTFVFVSKDIANVAVRRVGGRAGKATSSVDVSSETSHYFLKLNDTKTCSLFIEQINGIDFSGIVNDTAGVRSLSKPEFIKTLRTMRIID